MKNILVIADGLPAKHFVDRISGTKRDSNHYTIVIAGELEEPEYTQSYIKYHRFDPTSRSKIKDLMFRVDFDSVFIILDDLEESIEILDYKLTSLQDYIYELEERINSNKTPAQNELKKKIIEMYEDGKDVLLIENILDVPRAKIEMVLKFYKLQTER